jgi:hypothetical protein
MASPSADRIRKVLEDADLNGFESLLADDVRWGDDDHPRACRSRSDVMSIFSAMYREGVTASVDEVIEGPVGVVCHLRVNWPAQDRPDGGDLYHLYVLRGELIAEIRRYDDRRSAVEAAGVTA